MDERYSVGTQVVGRITGIQSYGAFVEINSNTQGLIHISEISERYVRDIRDFVGLGEEVTVKILAIDPKTGKLSLSLKEAERGTKQVSNQRSFGAMRVPKPSSQGFQILKSKLDEWIEESSTPETSK